MQRNLFLTILFSAYIGSAFAEIVPEDYVDEEGLWPIVIDVADADADAEVQPEAEVEEEDVVEVYFPLPPAPMFLNNVNVEDYEEVPQAPHARRVRNIAAALPGDFRNVRRRTDEVEEPAVPQQAVMQAMLNAMFAHRVAAQAPVSLEMIQGRLL